MRIAFCPTAHGFGHTSRQLALAKRLLEHGHEIHFFSHIPHFVQGYLPGVTVSREAFDVGLVQPNPVIIDIPETLQKLKDKCSEKQINSIANKLSSYDLVLADIPPIVLEACYRKNIPCLAISNFDWSWIYSHFEPLQAWAKLFAEWQSKHSALHIQPGPQLCNFKEVIVIPPLVRKLENFTLSEKRILIAFGGFDSNDLISSLPVLPGIKYVLAPPNPPCIRGDIEYCKELSYPQLISGCWAILGKPGYGLVTEAAQAGTPLILIPRSLFPETKYLREFSENHKQIWLCNDPTSKDFQEEFFNSILQLERNYCKTPTMFNGVSIAEDYLLKDVIPKLLHQ
jgi:hypothetical protein